MSYTRYMSGMSNGGSIMARHGEELQNEELAAAVPSLFATEAHESRSDRFVPIPTINVLDGLRAADFYPVFAQQARTRIKGKELFTRHMLRLRHRSLTNTAGEAFEVILVNANDGTAAYKMISGIFRFVCLNGLMTGDTFNPVHVRHAGKDVIEDVRGGAMNVLATAPRVLDAMDRFKGVTLNRQEALLLADAAHRLRFESAYEAPTDDEGNEIENALPVFNETKAPVSPIDLLRPARADDRDRTLWNAFNIIQERTIKGGQRGHVIGSKGQVRRAKVRAVKGIAQMTSLNQALWTLTEGMAALKGAGE